MMCSIRRATRQLPCRRRALLDALPRTVQTWMDLPSGGEAQVRGTIVGASQKKTGKKKGRYYEVTYDAKHNLDNEKVHVSEIRAMLA